MAKFNLKFNPIGKLEVLPFLFMHSRNSVKGGEEEIKKEFLKTNSNVYLFELSLFPKEIFKLFIINCH